MSSPFNPAIVSQPRSPVLNAFNRDAPKKCRDHRAPYCGAVCGGMLGCRFPTQETVVTLWKRIFSRLAQTPNYIIAWYRRFLTNEFADLPLPELNSLPSYSPVDLIRSILPNSHKVRKDERLTSATCPPPKVDLCYDMLFLSLFGRYSTAAVTELAPYFLQG